MKLIQVVKKNSNTVWEYLRLTEKQEELKYSEVTITEELLRNIYTFGNSLIAIEKPIYPEKITGADFMWIIRTPKKEHKLSFQAKRTYKPYSKYKKLNHKIQDNFQIHIFEQYSKKTDHVPYYILYNAIFSLADYWLPNYKHADIEIASQGRKFQSSLGITIAPLTTLQNNFENAYFDTITSDDTTRTLRQFLADFVNEQKDCLEKKQNNKRKKMEKQKNFDNVKPSESKMFETSYEPSLHEKMYLDSRDNNSFREISLLNPNKKLSEFEIDKILDFIKMKPLDIENEEILPPPQLIITDLT